VDQINFRIPAGQLGCSVPVAVKTGSVVSNFTSLAVSSSRPCSDPGGYPASAFELSAAKGGLNVGGFALTKAVLPAGAAGNPAAIMTEAADVAFNHDGHAERWQLYRRPVPPPPGIDFATTDYMQSTTSFVAYQ
jgi:hypothetical protein